MRIAFIVNSRIRNYKKLHSDIILFEQSQIAEKLSILETKRRGHAIRLAREASEDHDILIACGGDGTSNEVINGIMQSGKQVKFGFLPYGTANDLSKTLDIDRDITKLIRYIDTDSTLSVDLGHAKYYNENAESESRYFINEVDFGIGGYVVEKVQKGRKPFGAKFAFMQAIFNSLLTYEQSTVRLTCKEYSWQGKLLSLAVMNGKFFGSGIQIAKDASMVDGKFNLVLFHDISTWDYIRHVRKLRKGDRIDHEGVDYFTSSNISLVPEEMSCAIDIDGEFCGYAPANIEVASNAIQVFAPESARLKFA